jgi:tetratricopeptide (TPR) repeat protein
MSLFAAGLFRNNPNAPWWENLLVSAVCFAVLAFFMELGRRFGPTQKSSVKADEKTRQPVVPVATGTATSDAKWYVMRAGYELGPMSRAEQFGPLSLAELVEKAIAGEVKADDLVKQTGGIWNKACDSDFLEQFLPTESRRKGSEPPAAPAPAFTVPTPAGAFTMDHEKALAFLRQHGAAWANTPERERIFADLVAAGFAEKKGNGFVYTGNGDERGREKARLPAEKAAPGIGGWLILLAFGVLTGPFLTAYSIVCNFALFGTSMSANFQAVLMMETLVLSGMLLFQIYVAIAFFRRKATAPNLVIALLIARVVFDVIDLMAVASVTRASPAAGSLFGLLLAAGIWIPYLLLSRRVKATFVFGRAIGNSFARPLANEVHRDLAFGAPSAPRRPESEQGASRADPRAERSSLSDERIAALPAAAAASESGAEWRAIRAGNELGPVSLAELVEMAANGEIGADDLVKNHGGLWTKASEFGWLHQQFALRDSREEARRQAIIRRDRFHGIWLSKDNLAIIGGGVLLVLLLGFALWFSRRPVIPPMADAHSKDAAFYFNRGNSSLFPFFNGIPKDYDSAIQDYTEAIRLDPNYAPAFLNRADAWRAKKEYDIAITDYTEAIRLNPKDAGAYHNRGASWFATKNYENATRDYDEAIRHYNEAIRLNPKNGSAYHNRGIVWSNKMDYDRAIKDYTEAIRLNPSNGEAYRDRGIAWSNKKEYDSAIKDYTEAIRLNPNDAGAYLNRGFARIGKGDVAGSNKDFDEAGRLDPNRFPPNAWNGPPPGRAKP